MDLGDTQSEPFRIPLVEIGESFHVPFFGSEEPIVPPNLLPASSLLSGISLGELYNLRCTPFVPIFTVGHDEQSGETKAATAQMSGDSGLGT